MARNNDWQEKGVRIGGELLTEEEAKEIVTELRRRIKDPEIIEEIERVLRGEKFSLSERARDALRFIILGIVMRRDKRR